MYARRRRASDDPYLIELAVRNFEVDARTVRKILSSSNEVLVFCNSRDQAVGFICYSLMINGVAYINYAILDTAYQGRGLASKFLPNLANYARKRGIRAVLAFVGRDNMRAFKIFTSWGFQVVSSSPSGYLIGTFN